MRATTRLRELLAGPELLVAPGAYDALSARLIAQAGFSAVYMTGFGTAASFHAAAYAEGLPSSSDTTTAWSGSGNV